MSVVNETTAAVLDSLATTSQDQIVNLTTTSAANNVAETVTSSTVHFTGGLSTTIIANHQSTVVSSLADLATDASSTAVSKGKFSSTKNSILLCCFSNTCACLKSCLFFRNSDNCNCRHNCHTRRCSGGLVDGCYIAGHCYCFHYCRSDCYCACLVLDAKTKPEKVVYHNVDKEMNNQIGIS